MRRRAKSQFLDAGPGGEGRALDINVLSYSCYDATIHKMLGLNTKERFWKVQCRDGTPLTIQVLVDKTVLGRTEVSVKVNKEKLFPSGPSSEKSRLMDDFLHVWPFRGMAKGINEYGFVDVRLSTIGREMWYPGTVLRQRPDGYFEVMVTKQDVRGYWQDELYPFVDKRDLRENATKQPYTAPELHLLLKVPKSDPLGGAALLVNGIHDVARYFGRPTPNEEGRKKAPKVLLYVTKNRDSVTGNIGHRELLAYWNGEARAIDVIPKRAGKLVGYGSKMWKLQVGLCSHTIEVERKHKTSKHVTVTVDNEVLIEALAEDVGYHDGGWAAEFRFTGDPLLEFEVFETDTNGYPLESKGRVPLKRPYARQLYLSVEDMSDLANATLYVDGIEFRELPLHQQPHADTGQIKISPMAMSTQYGISVPYQVNKQATGSSAFDVGSLWNSMGSSPQNPNAPLYQPNDTGFMGLFSCCFAPPLTVPGIQEYSPASNYAAGQVGDMGPMVDVYQAPRY